MPKDDLKDTVQELYRSASQTRSHFGEDLDNACNYYADLVNFVSRVSPLRAEGNPQSLLDVGCGCGWSSFFLAKAGYRTTGVDLNPGEFEPPPIDNLTLREGNALALPFADSSFDIVVSYQCLEHVPKPEAALKEMIRVCKTNGIISIVGPNLVTPFLPAKFAFREIKTRRLSFRRQASTPRHPYGNTIPEHLAKALWATALLSQKLFDQHVRFSMRVPDTIPPFEADNDACYLCNPTDLIRFFRKNRLRVLQKGRHGRPPISYLFAGGTWVAAQKCQVLPVL